MKKILDKINTLFIYFRAAISFILFGPIVLILVIINPSNSSKYIIPFCKLMIFIFGCKLKIYGEFPENETYIIMANHNSFLDVFAVPCAYSNKQPFSAIAASKNFKIPIYASFLRRMKVVSIDRSNRTQAIAGVNSAEKILKQGFHITILPEGTRTSTGELGEFKKGGFHLASNSQALILPIITKGLFKIKPTNRWTIKPGIIEIYIKDPIKTQGKTVDELLQETRDIFLKTLNS